MKKSITGRIKHTCINYIFFALHLTKGQEVTKKKKKGTYEENSTYYLKFSFSNFPGIQSHTLYFN